MRKGSEKDRELKERLKVLKGVALQIVREVLEKQLLLDQSEVDYTDNSQQEIVIKIILELNRRPGQKTSIIMDQSIMVSGPEGGRICGFVDRVREEIGRWLSDAAQELVERSGQKESTS